MKLNENQLKAVNHIDGPCMVLAGPGSGKTRVITYRIKNLVENQNINPKNILAISFTKASSVEMKERSILLSDKINYVNFGTFHSIFFKILRAYNLSNLDSILSEKEKTQIIKSILKSINSDDLEDADLITTICNEISLCKNELIEPSSFKNKVLPRKDFVKVCVKYEEYKNQMKKIDFDDMLINCYHLLKENENILKLIQQKYKYILVDEFQDVNKVQFEVLKMISSGNIFVVGDEDQSIYSFRGARPDFLLEFEKYFKNTKKIILDINYRCDKNIINMSNKLIVKNKNRFDKVIKASKEGLNEVSFTYPKDVEEEAKDIGDLILEKVNKNKYSYSDFAVIYRTNVQSRAIVDIFLDMNIPFIVRDTIVSIYDHWVCKDILSYLKSAIYPALKDELSRVINKPFRYISRENIKIAMDKYDFLYALKKDCNLKAVQIRTIESLEYDLKYIKDLAPSKAISYIRTSIEYDRYLLEYCDNRKIKVDGLVEILNDIESSAKNFKSIKEYLSHIEKVKEEIDNQKNSSSKERVTLTTIHSAKGLEFENVFVIGLVEGIIPHEKSEKDIEEERRLLYVAMTRAKEKLYISSTKNRFNKKALESRFLKDIGASKPKNKTVKSGTFIYHDVFKEGKILKKKGETIEVQFKNKDIKILNYIYCIKNNIIKILDKSLK